jgi:aspartyl-tRNA(Asn)/glutamyl-tRNA(Gln) amidotransferase subunit A
MNVLARPDVRDPFALPPDGVDHAAGLDAPLKGRRVALILKYGDYHLDPSVEREVMAAAGAFEALGCVVEPATAPFDNAEAGGVWSIHWLSALQRLLQLYPEDRYGEFDPGLLEQAKIGSLFSLRDLVNAGVRRRELAHAWNLFLDRYDFAVSPTLNVLPWEVGKNLPIGPDGQPNYNWANTAVFNLTRHPVATVPCGLSDGGLPVGLQIIASHYQDALVLNAAAALLEARPFEIPELPG